MSTEVLLNRRSILFGINIFLSCAQQLDVNMIKITIKCWLKTPYSIQDLQKWYKQHLDPIVSHWKLWMRDDI